MNICLFSALIAIIVEQRTGSTWNGFKAGFLVLGIYIIWTYLMAERETRMANKAEEVESENE